MSKTNEELKQDIEAAKNALNNLIVALAGLSKMKDGKTLFEGSVLNDPECQEAWGNLNDCIGEGKDILKLP